MVPRSRNLLDGRVHRLKPTHGIGQAIVSARYWTCIADNRRVRVLPIQAFCAPSDPRAVNWSFRDQGAAACICMTAIPALGFACLPSR